MASETAVKQTPLKDMRFGVAEYDYVVSLRSQLAAKDAEISELRSERDALASQVAELRKLLRNEVDRFDEINRALHEEHMESIPAPPQIVAMRAALQEPSRDE